MDTRCVALLVGRPHSDLVRPYYYPDFSVTITLSDLAIALRCVRNCLVGLLRHTLLNVTVTLFNRTTSLTVTLCMHHSLSYLTATLSNIIITLPAS